MLRRVVLAAAAVLLGETMVFAQCSAPSYRKGRVFEDSPTSLTLAISIPITDFSLNRLACLGGDLKHRARSKRKVLALIFSSFDAASNYTVAQADRGPLPDSETAKLHDPAWLDEQLHAIYSYDADKGEEYIRLKPFGDLGDLPEDTRVDLPVAKTPRCRLELDQRCVLVAKNVTYPPDAYAGRTSGTVTLLGDVRRDGTMSRVRPSDESAEPGLEPLRRAAVENLRAWRLEPANRLSTFRLTYSYVIDASLAAGTIDVRYELPDRITVRVSPAR